MDPVLRNTGEGAIWSHLQQHVMHSEVFGILLPFAHGNDEALWSRRMVMASYGPQKPFDNACWDVLHTAETSHANLVATLGSLCERSRSEQEGCKQRTSLESKLVLT